MAFIKTISPAEAEGDVLAMYARQQNRYGYVPNYARVFCQRPQIMALWAQLLTGIRQNIDPKNFELATLSAACALKNSACSLAHGKVLSRYHSPAEIIGIVENTNSSVLSDAEISLASFARKVALDASAISSTDIDDLRQQGFSDGDIFDIAATAAARCFFAKLLDALGVEPDATSGDMDEALRACLTVGRAISTDPLERVTSSAVSPE